VKHLPDNLDLFGWTPPPPAAWGGRADAPAPDQSPERTAAEDAAAEVLAAVNASGVAFQRVVFTRNRSTMVSVTGGGSTLRLHERFATADAAVLAAIGRLFARGRRRDRDAARAVIRAFLRDMPVPPPRGRSRWVHPLDKPVIERLQCEFERVNREHFGGSLPAVPIYLSRVMKSRNGHFSSDPVEIVISWRLCVHGAVGEAEETVRHEMIHLWQHVNGGRLGHGPDFRRWARLLDVHPRARRAVRWKKG
jgi:hypothetical protein